MDDDIRTTLLTAYRTRQLTEGLVRWAQIAAKDPEALQAWIDDKGLEVNDTEEPIGTVILPDAPLRP